MKKLVLQPGETIVHSAPVFWKKYIFPTLMLFALTLASIEVVSMADFTDPRDITGFAIIIFFEVIVILGIVNLYAKRFIVTNRNIIKISGVFKKKTVTIPLSSCRNIMIQMNFKQRIFGGGNIHLQTGEKDIVLKNVQNPIRFRLKVMEQMTKELFNADTYAEHLKSGN